MPFEFHEAIWSIMTMGIIVVILIILMLVLTFVL